MDKRQIIEQMGRQRRVEEMVKNYTHSTALSADLEDLCQNIYIRLLDYPEYMLQDLWSHKNKNNNPAYGDVSMMDCFLLGIIRNQLSPTGPFGFKQAKEALFESIDGKDWIDNDTAQ